MRRSKSSENYGFSQQNPLLSEARKLRAAQRKRSASTLENHRESRTTARLASRTAVADAALRAEQRRHAKQSRQNLQAALQEIA